MGENTGGEPGRMRDNEASINEQDETSTVKHVNASLYASEIDDDVVSLLHEIAERGHVVALSPASPENESPFVRIEGRRKIAGTAAIRAYFGLPVHTAL